MTLVLFSLGSHLILTAASFQQPKREHLNAQEIDLVRDNQELDKRTQVFIKAAERRLLVLTNQQPAAQTKQAQKASESFGPLPTGTRAELLSDIARILDEAITNIDDTSTRNPDSPLLPKAIRKLAEASQKLIMQLTPLRASAGDEGSERESLEQALDSLQEIIEAAKKVPDDAPEKKGKQSGTND
ncbi:MAG: hypothetical protein ACRD9R_10625 [Pyrinomonadaceae bacterium]